MPANTASRHLRACAGFSKVVGQAHGQWDSASPCPEWDARVVVEHVIGFHDALLLGPLGAKPHRPREDTAVRWSVTVSAIVAVFDEIGASTLASVRAATGQELRDLLPMLTTEMLVHTWDLACAVGAERTLNADLCEAAFELARSNQEQIGASGMFATPVAVAEDASVADKLIALLCRDPAWPVSTVPPKALA